MGVEWQSRDFLTDWTGLFNRLQSIDVPPSYSRTCRNVDFWGSAIGKRLGTQIVNGWGTLAAMPGWTTIAAGSCQGAVLDATGFQVGDAVACGTATSGVVSTGTITSVTGFPFNIITIGSFTGPLPVPGQTAIFTRRELGGVVDGLYHAIYRDGTQQLLASVKGSLWDVWATPVGTAPSYVPGLLTTKFPTITVATANWLALNQGQISDPNTLVATDGSTYYNIVPNFSASEPDIIQIVHAGTVIYEGTIAAFHHSPTNTITLTANCAFAPVIGDQIILFPHGSVTTGTDTRFTMLNDRVYVAFAGGANTVKSGPAQQVNQRQPPVVVEQPINLTTNQPTGAPPYVRRMGIRPPTNFGNSNVVAGASGSGTLVGDYSWRYTYVNGATGQESEGGPEGIIQALNNQNALVGVWASPDPQVTQINIYRTLPGPSGTGPQEGAWYLVTELTNPGTGLPVPLPLPNTSFAYNDVTPDAGLGQLLKTFSNEPPPNSMTLFSVWTGAGTLIGINSGLIGEGGQVVQWGDAPDIVGGVYKLESWPINNTLFVNRDDGDHLVSLGVFYDSVVVWKGRSMHRIVGNPPDIILQPISFRDDHTGIGIWSAKGFMMDQDVAIFVSDDGFYQVSRYDGVQQGFTSSRISRQIDQEFYLRTGYSNSLLRANRELSHLLYHRVKRRLQAFVPIDGNNRPTDSFVYQLEGTVDGTPHGWSLWSVPVDYRGPSGSPPAGASFVSASCMVASPNQLDYPHYALGLNGLILKGDTGAGDWQGFPVTIMDDTVWFSGGGAGSVCRARAVDFVFIPTAGAPQPILRVANDFAAPDRYQLPALGALGMPQNVNPLILELGQYQSIGFEETSITGLFLCDDFTLWFQKLPVGVTARIIPTPLFTNPGGPAATP